MIGLLAERTGNSFMINLIWALMIVIGVVVAILTGNIDSVNSGVLEGAEDAVSLCITMFGVVGMWSGIMRIAEKSGLMDKWTGMLAPVMKFLFPGMSAKSRAYKYICTNIIANVVGLGWAATPPALQAMAELAKENGHSKIASRDMCTFLILNISSLQLIPVSIIAYRAKYGAANPAMIILPGLIATACSTVVAVFLCYLINKHAKDE